MFLEKLNSICSSILQGFREYHFIIPFLHMGSRQYYSTTNKFYNFIFTVVVVVAQHDSHHRKKAIKNYITAIMLSTKIHFSNLSTRYYQTKKSVFTTLVGVLLSFSPSLAPQRRRLLNFLREEKRVGVGHTSTSIQGQQQQTFCLTGLPSRPSSSVHIHTRRVQTDGRTGVRSSPPLLYPCSFETQARGHRSAIVPYSPS